MAKNGLMKIAALALAIGVGAMGCKGAEKKPERYDIKISESILIRRGLLEFSIEYNGMNNGTFSVSNNSNTAVNTYYPLASKRIYYKGMDFSVIEVTPEHLILEK